METHVPPAPTRRAPVGAAMSTYLPPAEDAFKDISGNELAFLPAPDLERIGRELIAEHSDYFRHLNNFRIVFLWKKEGGLNQGRPVMGACQRATGIVQFWTSQAAELAHFVIWLAADHVRAGALREYKVRAIVHHELLHAGISDKGAPTIWGHDFEGFIRDITEYGAWTEPLKRVQETFGQLELPLDADPARAPGPVGVSEVDQALVVLTGALHTLDSPDQADLVTRLRRLVIQHSTTASPATQVRFDDLEHDPIVSGLDGDGATEAKHVAVA